MSLTANQRENRGVQYARTAFAQKHSANASDWAKKNQSTMRGVWNSRGRNGKTPPHTPAAFMARNRAYPSEATLGLSMRAARTAPMSLLPTKPQHESTRP